MVYRGNWTPQCMSRVSATLKVLGFEVPCCAICIYFCQCHRNAFSASPGFWLPVWRSRWWIQAACRRCGAACWISLSSPSSRASLGAATASVSDWVVSSDMADADYGHSSSPVREECVWHFPVGKDKKIVGKIHQPVRIHVSHFHLGCGKQIRERTFEA